MPFLLILFLVVPLAEIYLLIEIGQVIGAPWTIFAVVFTAVVGAALVRAQGVATVQRIQANLREGVVPAVELMEGACLLLAGALLLTPGFVTDAFGGLCLIPPLRRAVIVRALQRTMRERRAQADAGAAPTSPPGDRRGRVIEGDWRSKADD